MRSYNHVEHTWGEPFFWPAEWATFARTSEASLCRAANGDLVASFRSGRPGPSGLAADKWRGLVTATSADDGVRLHPSCWLLGSHACASSALVGSVLSLQQAVGHHSKVCCNRSIPGHTWSWPMVHSLYAHVHSSLLTLPDGRILLTYAARVGEIGGQLYHDHEVAVSHDHGATPTHSWLACMMIILSCRNLHD